MFIDDSLFLEPTGPIDDLAETAAKRDRMSEAEVEHQAELIENRVSRLASPQRSHDEAVSPSPWVDPSIFERHSSNN